MHSYATLATLETSVKRGRRYEDAGKARVRAYES